MRKIILRTLTQAADEIEACGEFFRTESGEELANRWETSLDESLRTLLQFPQRGVLVRFRSGVCFRRIPVLGFRNYLIFYEYQQDQRLVQIVGVIHGARDVESLLADFASDL
jgi:plasmid stabilization system protein ParE